MLQPGRECDNWDENMIIDMSTEIAWVKSEIGDEFSSIYKLSSQNNHVHSAEKSNKLAYKQMTINSTFTDNTIPLIFIVHKYWTYK